MVTHTIRIQNHTAKSQTYIIFPEDLYVLESTKNAVLVPRVVSDGCHDFTIDTDHHVWAKLSTSSEPVFAKADVGVALSIKTVKGKAVISRTGRTPDPGCFSVTIDESFSESNLFGLAIKVPSIGIHPITTKHTAGVATYDIEPSNTFQVAVNKRYRDGDEIRDDSTIPLSTKVDFADNIKVVTVSHSSGVAEELHLGEDPARVQSRNLQELQSLKAQVEVKRKTEDIFMETTSLLTVETLDLPKLLDKIRAIGVSLEWSGGQKQAFVQKIQAHADRLAAKERSTKQDADAKLSLARDLSRARDEIKQLKNESERKISEVRQHEATEKQSLASQLEKERKDKFLVYYANREYLKTAWDLRKLRERVNMLNVRLHEPPMYPDTNIGLSLSADQYMPAQIEQQTAELRRLGINL